MLSWESKTIWHILKETMLICYPVHQDVGVQLSTFLFRSTILKQLEGSLFCHLLNCSSSKYQALVTRTQAYTLITGATNIPKQCKLILVVLWELTWPSDIWRDSKPDLSSRPSCPFHPYLILTPFKSFTAMCDDRMCWYQNAAKIFTSKSCHFGVFFLPWLLENTSQFCHKLWAMCVVPFITLNIYSNNV